MREETFIFILLYCPFFGPPPSRTVIGEKVSSAHKTTCKQEDKCQSVKDPSLSERPSSESKQARGSRALLHAAKSKSATLFFLQI